MSEPDPFAGKCMRCRFMVEHRATMECHRNAPVPGHDVTYNAARWPNVKANDWCGEFALPSPPKTEG